MGYLDIPAELASFKTSSGRIDINLDGFRGFVVADRAWSETETYSRTRIYPTSVGGRASFSAVPEIDSRVTQKHEFFLRDGDVERSVRLHDIDFPVREGHEVVVMWAIPSDRDRGLYVWAHNRTTGTMVEIPPDDEFIARAEFEFPKFVAFLHFFLFGATLLSLIVAGALGRHGGGVGIAFVAVAFGGLSIWSIIRLSQTKRTFHERLREKLSAIHPIADGQSIASPSNGTTVPA